MTALAICRGVAVRSCSRWPRRRAAQAPLAVRSGRRGRWPRATCSFPPYEIQTLPNGLQVVAVLHHEQPVVSMRMIVRAGGALDPKDKLGLARPRGRRCSTQGTDDAVGQRAERRDRLHRRRDGRRRRHRSELRQHGRDEGQLRGRPAHAVRHGAASGVRAGGDRAAAPADAVEPAGQLRGSRSSSPTPCSTGWSTASIRTACRRPARRRRSPRITRDDLVAFHQPQLRAEQRHPRDRRRRHGRGGVRRRDRRCSATGSGARCRRDASSRRPIRRAASSSSTSRTRCRPRSASGTSASAATTPTTWRSTWRSAFSAARAPTACTRCCGPSAG